ncbi:VC0807 family protein [Streptomyces natalensis]|nr:VC0807 family protein [Streptomyces natalensis]
MTAITAPQPSAGRARLAALTPLLVDAALPLAGYYLLSKGLGVGTVAALAISSVPPALSAAWTALRRHRVNGLAALTLATTAAGIALSAVTGDPRLMLAKDGVVSSVIGIAILLSAAVGRPLMSAALKPMITKADPARMSAWDRLSRTSAEFRDVERGVSVVWGVALLAECAARVIGAYALPVATMLSVHSLFVIAGVIAAIKFSKSRVERMSALLRSA